jgi:ATP-dependent Clp protease ATP-binding subunit ClpC
VRFRRSSEIGASLKFRWRAIERRFELVEVCEPTHEEALEILRGLRGRIENHHRSRITGEALNAAVDLSIRYAPERRLPDKAIDLLDQACAQARLRSLSGDLRAQFRDGITIGREEIAMVIAHRRGIPLGELTEDEGARLLKMEEALRTSVKGQDHAIVAVSQAIRLSRSGLKNPNKPIGVFLFVGATGSGKTELAKALAEFLFRDEKKLLRFDMSEFMDEHSVSKLIGSPPGFLGHEAGGQLTEQIRSYPHSVVLLDEIEKAHPKILNIFLQVFDEGVLTDSKGRRCDFRDAVVILTSNLGSHVSKPVGFHMAGTDENAYMTFSETVLADVKRTLRPELVNRLTEIVVFQPLQLADAGRVIDKFIDRLNERLHARSIQLALAEEARELLLKEGFSEAFGAREIERTVERLIARPLAEELLRSHFRTGGRVIVVREAERLIFKNE